MGLLSLNVVLGIGLGIILILTTYLASNMSSREHFIFMLVMLFVGFIILGNILEYNSTSIDGAIAARKVSFFGSCFAEWLLFIFCFKFLHINYNKHVIRILFFFHCIVFVSAMTLEHHHLIYTSMKFKYLGSIGRMISTPGPVNYLHKVLMLLYAIAIPGMCIYFYCKNRKTEVGNNALILAACAVLPAIGFISMSLGIGDSIDDTPLFFVLSIIMAFVLIIRKHAFDVIAVAREQLIDELDDAVVILDSDFKILYANNSADKLFPHLTIDNQESDLITSLVKNMDEQFQQDGRTYNLHINQIKSNKRLTGFSLVFSDITGIYDYAMDLEDQINAKAKEMILIQKRVLFSLADMIEMRDDTTGQHVKRTSEFVRILSSTLLERGMFRDQLSVAKVERMSEAAALHDIGKIAVSDTILRKPGKLTDEEFEEIKKHTTAGGEILSHVIADVGDVPYLEEAREMALYHHEKYNGTGYPEGLKGEDIPISARIMAVSDVFDALISKRQYKDAFSLDKAFSIIEESKGSHFDPEIAQVFIDIRPEVERIVEEISNK